ncbi:P-loop containing nucleoside triphosphate hydrolase protein [Crassisporium funariophilum]|nr:P-loop containing nucleoside triphosphate hydrolase protein [Crassisporium funariophilum]
MATRRPASRARLNTNINTMQPPQQPRPKSAMAKTTTSQRVGEELLGSQSSSSSIPKLHKGQEESESHIQVILRCRGRSEREIQENSPGIVQIDGAKSKDLTIETSPPISSLGIVTPPPTRTYPFDLVFGPEATQSMIYHEVVAPMLKEVLLGYNCTLFAYGQTGTGKTYTMQGDVRPTPMGNPSANAGIIPRVLFRLFHELETSYTDFVVKVSYIELYNEELRDLLGNELAAPTNLTQPMGMAAKDAKGADAGLKIFDDASKRGVVIQGLEEIAVKDSKAALALLMKGSERRQIAATKFNDHSSRSHSVFSITVHIKETNNIGDDLLKIGKLNLVDLAGSENIGRSGAENKRAREAGMINQSLLTLGRVINALVEKAQHVPYRESKLTRLLQDSLGGRTKTCIITTISPARSNLEETLSTLDYAMRAKSIRNKPELNQRMTRNSLLREYVVEIERLKADLLAAREKNGIFFSEETWIQLNAERELRETELIEAKKRVEIVEVQMRDVRDELDESIARYKGKEAELEITKGRLEDTEHTLRLREGELQTVTNAYEDEVVVRQAHQDTENSLNDVALGLKGVVAQSLRDISGLFDKLDRKDRALLSQKRAVSENEKLVHLHSESLAKLLTEFTQMSRQTTFNLELETKQFGVSEQMALTAHLQKVEEQFHKAEELFQQIQTCDLVEENTLATLQREFNTAHKSLKAETSSWVRSLEQTCERLCSDVIDTSTKQVTLLDEAITLLYSLVEGTLRETQKFLTDEHSALTEMKTLTEAAASQETLHLKRQNNALAQMLVNERKSAEKAKDELIQRVSGLLGDYTQKRDESLRECVGSLQRSNTEVEDLLTSTLERQSEVLGDMAIQNKDLREEIRGSSKQGLDIKTNSAKVSAETVQVIKTGVEDVQSTVSHSISSYSSSANKRTRAMADHSASAFDEHSRSKRTRLTIVDSLHADMETSHSVQQDLFASTSKRVESYTSQTLSMAQEHAQFASKYQDAASEDLDIIEQAATNLANSDATDEPSGSTPRRRKWQYSAEWSLTKSRDEVVAARKQQLQLMDIKNNNNQKHKDTSMNIKDDINSKPEPQSSSDQRQSVSRFGIPDAENATTSDTQHRVKSETVDAELAYTEPLVESRKRNFVSTTRSSRRAR